MVAPAYLIYLKLSQTLPWLIADASDLDRFGTDVPVRPRKDGGAEVSVTVRKSAQFFGWVAGMNGAVTIAGPKRLAEEYRAWLQGLAEQA